MARMEEWKAQIKQKQSMLKGDILKQREVTTV
jgi:hypothetical protein